MDWSQTKHFPHLSADQTERLAQRGIDPERSIEDWLTAIRTGGFSVSAMHDRAKRTVVGGAKLRSYEGKGGGPSPGAWRVPSPIPLALVLPSDA